MLTDEAIATAVRRYRSRWRKDIPPWDARKATREWLALTSWADKKLSPLERVMLINRVTRIILAPQIKKRTATRRKNMLKKRQGVLFPEFARK